MDINIILVLSGRWWLVSICPIIFLALQFTISKAKSKLELSLVQFKPGLFPLFFLFTKIIEAFKLIQQSCCEQVSKRIFGPKTFWFRKNLVKKNCLPNFWV